MLITETTAFHDRKTEDLEDDGGKVHPDGGGASEDDHSDYDQRRRPEGSLFVELYNPAGPFDAPSAATDQNPPYMAGTAQNYVGCVRLNQVTPNDGHPVWRLAIPDPDDFDKDPDNPNVAQRPDIERSVYFVDPGTNIESHGEAYHPSNTNIAPVLPGRYAVIGPAAETNIGRRTDGQTSKTRKIKLMVNDVPNATGQVVVEYNMYPLDSQPQAGTNELPTDEIKPPTAVIINQPRRLSVSEPTGGYTDVNYDPNTDTYDPVILRPLDSGVLLQTGTTPNYRVVHLQRLANPRLPWKGLNSDDTMPTDGSYNPYITIDSQPVDLTAFNGEDEIDDDTTPDDVMLASHQRGEDPPAEDGVNNLWKIHLEPKTVTDDPIAPVVGDLHIFKHVLQHTLGYLNEPFGAPYAGSTDPTNSATGWRSYRGDPQPSQHPFPWLTWNNRPFVSQYELMLVPWVRQSRLLRYYNIAQPGNPYMTVNVPFPHLLNLFPSGPPGDENDDEELHRIFEYLHVPSRFVGTGTWANPTAAANSTGHAFHPPFNRISAYREPGRINLNTIYSRQVYDGLMNDGPGASWLQFLRSRRGYDAAGAATVFAPDINNQHPTLFGKPFRSFGGAAMVPTLTDDVLKYDKEIDATLLREGTSNQPLFQYDSDAQVDNTDRNPYFRYQGIQRLGNLVTTRSNVYAVWITVGYFEVTPWGSVDAAHPDGYQLGRELGMDTGEIERHRAFFIFDRSIPVGFQRGRDLNVEKAVLVDRFIE